MPNEQLALTRSCRATAGKGHRFYVCVAATLVALNIVGFAPTYFLMGPFEAPALPFRTHIHGPLFSAWSVLFLVQTTLVARARTSVHQRLGIAGGLLALAMVCSGVIMIVIRAGEYEATGGVDDARNLADTATVVWANLNLLVSFAAFAGLGIWMRHRASVHKRLMLLASISMMPQALGRIAGFPALGVNPVYFALGSLLLLLLAPAIHDVVDRGRVHPVTAWGSVLFFLSLLISAVIIPTSDIGQNFVLTLSSL